MNHLEAPPASRQRHLDRSRFVWRTATAVATALGTVAVVLLGLTSTGSAEPKCMMVVERPNTPEPGAPLRSEPTGNPGPANIIVRLPSGTIVQVIGQRNVLGPGERFPGLWYRVTTRAASGWMHGWTLRPSSCESGE
jgi:hypothetical protein